MDLDAGVALITLNELKEYLKVSTGTTGEEQILQALLNSACTWVTNYLGRNLLKQTYVEYYDGDGSVQLVLRNTPVVSITSIYVDYLRAWAADKLVNSTDYFIRKESGIVEAFYLFGNWLPGRANIKVTYVAGYLPDIDKTEAQGGMPHSVRLAIKRICDHHYRTGYTNRKLDVSSETRGDLTTTFKDGDMQKDVLAMLQPYRAPLSTPGFSYAD
ncbi:phage gp6-like head-tail connector protein [Candidatus Parcubacteria bacterium]|nr:phage gp6-like head-tail connector protein [Candidatus Parcubacteria bacterium]